LHQGFEGGASPCLGGKGGIFKDIKKEAKEKNRHVGIRQK
jgi:hypothetical protein